MPTTIEVLCPGAVLEGEIRFAPHATDVERGAVCYGLHQLRTVGGKGGAGFGCVDVDAPDPDDSAAYLAWRDTTTDLRARLVALSEKMGATTKKAKGKGK
jgi:hypothetical protein